MSAVAPEALQTPRFEHPEGIVWDSHRSRLIWLDVFQGHVHIFNPSTGGLDSVELGQPVGAVAPRRGGGLVCAVRDGFGLMSDEGELTVVSDHLRDNPQLQMNDGGVDPAGRFWAGTVALESGAPNGALYRLDPDLSVHRELDGVTVSNGIGWTPDSSGMYYVDSAVKRINRFEFDSETAALGERTTLAEVDAVPDGLAVDVEGCVWVALWEGHRVIRITPSGAIDRTVRLPGSQVSTCTFGGSDRSTLFIAVSPYGQDPSAPDARGAGYIYAFDAGVEGLATHEFAG